MRTSVMFRNGGQGAALRRRIFHRRSGLWGRFVVPPLIIVGVWLWLSAMPTPAGIPQYPGPATPHAGLLFPVVRDTFVELHYVPVLRVGRSGAFLTAMGAVRRMPPRPASLTVVNPNTIAQRDARVEISDPATGLVLIRAPFEGPVYPLADRPARPGETVLLTGPPYRRMGHQAPTEHRVPDLRPLQTVGRVTGEGEVSWTGAPVHYGVSPGWAVLDEEGRKLLGLIARVDGKKAGYVSAEQIRAFLSASGVRVP